MDDAGANHFDTNWNDWREDNGTYQHGQDHIWSTQDDPPYESEVRAPYNREDDHGSKRKTQTKLDVKPQKRAKVDPEPKR